MRSRRVAFATALGALIALAAVGAGAVQARGDKSSRPQTAQKTAVTLAGWASSPEETRALNRTVASFERFNKDIDVRYTPISGDYDAAMLARFAAKRPPDVFYVDSLDVPDYLPALEPLNSYINKTKGFSTKPFYPRLLSGFTVNGRIYGFPKDWSPLAMEVNTAMLQRAGVRSAPQTWVQFRQALQRLRSTNAVPDGAPACLSLDWARILAFMYQNRGAWLNARRTASVIDSAANNATLNTYIGWIKSGLAKTPQQLGVGWCGEALGKEKAAIIFEGNWVYGFMQKDFPSVRFAVQPMIRNKINGNLSFTVSYSIGKQSRNKQAAWRLLRFLVGRNGQLVWTRNSGFLPSRSDVRPPAGRANFVKAAPYARPWQLIKGFDRVNDLAGKELEKTFNGDQNVATMLRNIDQATEDAIRRGR
jgi:multiple sugar transport system substrate-binding protein